jgi:hypothetical protein
MDHAGAVFIGTALLMLFGRIIVAHHHGRAIRAALTQHHRPTENSLPMLLRRLGPQLGNKSIVLGTTAVFCALVPAAVQALLGSDSAVGRAAGVVFRWVTLFGTVGMLRARATSAASRPAP